MRFLSPYAQRNMRMDLMMDRVMAKIEAKRQHGIETRYTDATPILKILLYHDIL